MSTLRYFYVSFAFTIAGLGLGAYLGYVPHHSLGDALSTALICGVLGVLEISLSLDNAIVNARILAGMPEAWQKRFLTWGIIIAVFGMRIIFPLAIVAIAGGIGPVATITLALFDPNAYARVLTSAHVSISAFGGSFLLMVGLDYFIDTEKDVHWVAPLEKGLSRLAGINGIAIAITLAVVLIVSYLLPTQDSVLYLRAAIYGLLAFLAVEGLTTLVAIGEDGRDLARKTGAAAFLYLEVLDASFSLDGVIGAFALTKDIFVIAIGLGIGAAYVRSMTLTLVDRRTLAEYRFLEHGAFYAILALALIMYAQILVDVPEFVTGVIGAALIVAALVASIVWTRRHQPDRRGS